MFQQTQTPPDAYVGGILGYVNTSGFTGINNCFNTGTLSSKAADTYCGAIIGWGRNGVTAAKITNNYYLEGAKAVGKTNDTSVTATVKTADEFAGGEVAYLLQKVSGDTLVWGQNSSEDGATPIITTNEDYRVLPVMQGDAVVNYSVLRKGEINGDGIVDVYDYQALVNIALSETNTKDFADKYDLNGDGTVDVLDIAAAPKDTMSEADYNDLVSKVDEFEGACYMKNADFDGDGVVDVLDISAIEKLLSGHRVKV